MHETVNLAPLWLRRFESFPAHNGNSEAYLIISMGRNIPNRTLGFERERGRENGSFPVVEACLPAGRY